MKLLHISDLHLGKRLHEQTLIADQKHVLEQIVEIAKQENSDGIIIAGDVYDKTTPTVEAVLLFDEFLTELAKIGQKVYVVAGNHDSIERMSFGSRLIETQGIYVARAYDGKIHKVVETDEHGQINIYLLPFIKPANVKRYTTQEIKTYEDAVKMVLENAKINSNERNILVTHQLVIGAIRSESEEIMVGGTEGINAEIFDEFDYVALGHLHRPQNCKDNKIRYCGTPLKYSFSECNDKKSVTVVEIKRKGETTYRTIPLTPLHDLVEIRGRYDEIMLKSYYENTTLQSDYIKAILTDEDDVVDAMAKLRSVYRNILTLCYDNTRTQTANRIEGAENPEQKKPIELFDELFKLQINRNVNDEEREFLEEIIEEVWQEEK